MRWLVVRWEVFATRWAHQLICESEEERLEGVRVGMRGAWVVAPNSVDTDEFRPPSEEERRDARLSVGSSGPTAVCIGRLCRAKGQDVLLEAWSTVLRAVPGAELILVGGYPTSGGVPSAILADPLPPRVRLVGQQDDVRPWLRAADLVIAPSRWDTHSLAILEAMACGRSVVATDVAGARASLGEIGAVVSVEDPSALAEAVVARLMDSALREREGRAARLRVEALYSTRDRIHEIGDLYPRVTRAFAPRRRQRS
jgi:glycosyltransferase involved in cell wall biosynthesis